MSRTRGVDRPSRLSPLGFLASIRGLRVQILLWIVLPLTLVLIGVALTGVYSHEHSMRVLVQERDTALAVVGSERVADVLRAKASDLQALSSAQAFHHLDEANQRALLSDAETLNSFSAGAPALIDRSGRALLVGTSRPGWLDLEDFVQSAAVAVFASGAPGAVWVDPVDLVLLGVAVQDEDSEVYATLMAPFSLDKSGITDVLDRIQVGEHGTAHLVDHLGRSIAHSESLSPRDTFSGHSGLDIALEASGAGAVKCRAPNGEQMTLAYAPVEFAGLNWWVIIEQPWEEVIGPVLRYSQFVPLVAVLAVIVSLLALYYGVTAIVRPLRTLGQRAEQLAWGDFQSIGSPVGGVQEIEDLRQTLDQMAERIRNYQGGMHDYIGAITTAQEEERKRLARELHDETAQTLIALRHQVEMAQRLHETDPSGEGERLDQVRVMLAEALEDVRRFSRDLRPIYLEDLGFIPALEMKAKEISELHATQVQTSISGRQRRLPDDLELTAYRIAQEALSNIVQHSSATQAWVHVRFDEDYLILSIRDNGRGFISPTSPRELAALGHFGLMGLHERTVLHGGRLDIETEPGAGTLITVHLPYPSS